MVQLVLLLGPIASALGGISTGRLFTWSISQLFDDNEDEKDNKKETKKPKNVNKKSSD